MNMILIKTVLLIGLSAGSSYLVTTHVMKKKYESILQEELKSIKESFGITKAPVAQDSEVTESDFKNTFQKADIDYAKEVKNDYSQLVSQYQEKPTLEEALISSGVQDCIPDELPNRPYTITETEFSLEEFQYAKVEVIYHEMGARFENVNTGCEVTDPHALFGSHVCDSFFFNKDVNMKGLDCVYVRNDSLSADFEIMYGDGGFNDGEG